MSTLKKVARIILAPLMLLFIIPSCEKQANQNLTQISGDDEVSLSQDASNLKLTLRPGPNTGQDVYVAQQDGVSSGNVNYVPELSISEWTVGGAAYHTAAYIRFDSLRKIPTTATVVSAKLYLYTPYSSASTPQGNSGDNASYVDRVTGIWDESTLTYNNQPTHTTVGQAILPASTSTWGYSPVVDVTEMVSVFVAHPNKNHGFFISLITQQIYRSLIFSSSEADKSLRPKLVVSYE